MGHPLVRWSLQMMIQDESMTAQLQGDHAGHRGFTTSFGGMWKFSPLAACWYNELGGLNKFVHTWVYKDLNERARVREAARTSGGAWPPRAGVRPMRQENKLLVPAAFSPMR